MLAGQGGLAVLGVVVSHSRAGVSTGRDDRVPLTIGADRTKTRCLLARILVLDRYLLLASVSGLC